MVSQIDTLGQQDTTVRISNTPYLALALLIPEHPQGTLYQERNYCLPLTFGGPFQCINEAEQILVCPCY